MVKCFLWHAHIYIYSCVIFTRLGGASVIWSMTKYRRKKRRLTFSSQLCTKLKSVQPVCWSTCCECSVTTPWRISILFDARHRSAVSQPVWLLDQQVWKSQWERLQGKKWFLICRHHSDRQRGGRRSEVIILFVLFASSCFYPFNIFFLCVFVEKEEWQWQWNHRWGLRRRRRSSSSLFCSPPHATVNGIIHPLIRWVSPPIPPPLWLLPPFTSPLSLLVFVLSNNGAIRGEGV